MTTKHKSAAPEPSLVDIGDTWIDLSGAQDQFSSTAARSWMDRLRAWLLLDDQPGDPTRWRHSAYKIILSSSLLLCLTIAVHSFATAWSQGVISVIVTVTGYYVALIAALHIGQKHTSWGACLLLLMVYLCGLLILFGIDNQPLSDLGVIFLYVAPIIGWIYFGPTKAVMLMTANILPFLYMVSPERPLAPLGIDLSMPNSHLYLHALLFLFLNFSIPLALFRVVSALNTSVLHSQRIARQLQQSTLLYRDMFEHANGPILICDRGGRILKANKKACVLLEKPNTEIEADNIELGELFVPATAGRTLDNALQMAMTAGFSEGEFLIRQSSSTNKEALLTIKSLSQRCLLVSVRDISTFRSMERDLLAATSARDRLIAYDPATGLPNRESLQEQLQKLMADQTLLQRGTLLSVACVRLNSIRSINEKFGHQRGDELIRQFGKLLSQYQQANFQLFRLRGVVFLIVITGCIAPEQIEALLEKFLAELPKQLPFGNQTIDLDLSVGVAFTRGKEISASDLIHRSERALEIARKHVKGPLVLFNEDSAREIHREIDISMAMSRALTHNEFSLVYQPKVDAEKSIQGLEALIRWNSAELGSVSPAEFIPVAEQIGRIQLISDFVIEEVCRQLAHWYANLGKVWPVAVNLSGIDLQRDDLPAVIQKALQRHQIEPAWLQLEITETGLIENDHIARRNIEKLIAIGLRIAIDDFGTGYSSLKKLSEYPIHSIKIDRSFVMAIGKNRRSDRIIQLILTLAKVLDCEVVAEGVETRRQLQFLQENGCRRFQGYLFYKPSSAADIDQLIAQKS